MMQIITRGLSQIRIYLFSWMEKWPLNLQFNDIIALASTSGEFSELSRPVNFGRLDHRPNLRWSKTVSTQKPIVP
jgi:hypothetical protein